MKAEVEERRLGQLRWLVVTGDRIEAFRQLGCHIRAEIQAVVALPQTERLRQFVARSPGRDRLRSVRHATELAQPDEWAEVAALADGAEVALDDLALLHFRGDLGDTSVRPANESLGCSDIAWRRESSFIAHNEDGPAYYGDRCPLLTLSLDGEQRVTALCYPGMLPSAAFSISETGLAYSISHLSAAAPGPHAGRHFVSRGFQRHARNADQAIRYLQGHPCAGGYAYNIGDRSGRVVMIETSAGQFACGEVGLEGPIDWHTNHGRYVAGAEPNATGSSVQRAEVLQSLKEPAQEPDFNWFTEILMGAPPPIGAREDLSPTNKSLITLCSFVVSLRDGRAVVLWRGKELVSVPLDPFAPGPGEASSKADASAMSHQAARG